VNHSLSATWSGAWRDRAFRIHGALTLLVVSSVLTGLARLLTYVEARPGVVVDDPILRLFAPADVTWLTFGMIYLGLVTALWFLVKDPRDLLVALQCYAVMGAIRILMMYSLPLDPPRGAIALADPFVQLFGPGSVPTKDLFFSGHTSTMFLLFLTTQKRPLKILFLFCTVAVGVAVLWQHVHYTIDVLVAPVVSYTSYRIVVQCTARPILSTKPPTRSADERH
jgi:membrane-associated phospholipid phosphatase